MALGLGNYANNDAKLQISVCQNPIMGSTNDGDITTCASIWRFAYYYNERSEEIALLYAMPPPGIQMHGRFCRGTPNLRNLVSHEPTLDLMNFVLSAAAMNHSEPQWVTLVSMGSWEGKNNSTCVQGALSIAAQQKSGRMGFPIAAAKAGARMPTTVCAVAVPVKGTLFPCVTPLGQGLLQQGYLQKCPAWGMSSCISCYLKK